MTAETIKQLLADKHIQDIGGPEVLTGPGGSMRFDYWALKKSWTNPASTGYEIKVSRGDFLQDDKWPQYLRHCQYFYFVCPADLISVEEAPSDCGLMWVTKTGSRLYTKKKAPYRPVEISRDVLLHLMMWRNTDNGQSQSERNENHWKAWRDRKGQFSEVGRDAGRRLQQLYDQDVEAVRSKNRHLESRIEHYQVLQDFLDNHNLHIGDWRVEQKVKNILAGGLPEDTKRKLDRAKDAIEELLNQHAHL